MRYNVLIGGQAGQGPNYLTKQLADALIKKGYFVFFSRDYQSLIRGGHNFNVLTFSDEIVYSNDSEIDVIVALDDNTEKIHKKELKKEGKIIKTDSDDKQIGKKIIDIFKLKDRKNGFSLMNGSQGIAEGAVKSGLDIYYAYPMTPATPVLFELAQRQEKDNFLVFQLENEISVAMTGVGSALTGAKVMVGTSGGGFDLMTETLSMTGMAEVPLVFYLSQRPGPGTGIPTYTGQSDLMMALHSGHGEFSRLVIAPGDPIESQELTSQCFYFSQKFRMPCIILNDKHLAEATYPILNTEKPVITKIGKINFLRKYSSYEHRDGIATDDPEITKKNFESRLKKAEDIKKEAGKFSMFKIFGNKNSKNVIVSWGSTKGAILDAIKDLDVKFIQVLYLDPFPVQIEKELQGKNIILVENSATGMLADLIREKTGIKISENNKVLRYDGRPFLCDELKEEIKGAIEKS